MTNLSEITRRTRRYWLIDGLPELFIGGFFLVFSALQAVLLVVPPGIAGFGQLLIPLVVLVFCLGGRRVLQALKARTTYPHTGYVEYPEPSPRQWTIGTLVGLVIGLAVPALFGGWFFVAPDPGAKLPLLVGAVTALMMLYLGWYLGARRFYILGAFSLLAGLGVMLLPLPATSGYLLVFVLIGLWLLVSGARTFRQYRRAVGSLE